MNERRPRAGEDVLHARAFAPTVTDNRFAMRSRRRTSAASISMRPAQR